MTHNTSKASTSTGTNAGDEKKNTRQSAGEEAWSQVVASHRQLQRVEDTLGVAHACMHEVEVGFFTGVYTPREVLALGEALLDWADKLHGELAQLRTAHQAHVDAWLTSSKHIA